MHLPNLLIFDRWLQCRPTVGVTAGKGAEKLDRASPIGWHKQIGLNCTGCRPSAAGGLPQCLWRGNEVSDGRLRIYGNPLPHAAMAAEAKGSEAAGLVSPRCWVRRTHLGRNALYDPSSASPGV